MGVFCSHVQIVVPESQRPRVPPHIRCDDASDATWPSSVAPATPATPAANDGIDTSVVVAVSAGPGSDSCIAAHAEAPACYLRLHPTQAAAIHLTPTAAHTACRDAWWHLHQMLHMHSAVTNRLELFVKRDARECTDGAALQSMWETVAINCASLIGIAHNEHERVRKYCAHTTCPEARRLLDTSARVSASLARLIPFTRLPVGALLRMSSESLWAAALAPYGSPVHASRV